MFTEPGEIKTFPYECPDNYFKCPGNYCIPLHYVCDGEWQCPDGEDEIQCGELQLFYLSTHHIFVHF